MFQIYFVSVAFEGYEQFSFNRSHVFHLTGQLRTAILADTYNLRTPSKDHTRNTVQTGAKMIPYIRVKNLQNSTLPHGLYLYSPYKGVTSLLPPFHSAVSKLLLIQSRHVDRSCPDPEGHHEFVISWICKICKVYKTIEMLKLCLDISKKDCNSTNASLASYLFQ